MRFLYPGYLWALASAAAVLALYLLKLRRREKTVASTWLWEKALADMRADAPFRRLRSELLLWLQLAAAVLLALAAARPYFGGAGRQAAACVLVLDASASMQAEGRGGSRFEAARAALLARLDAAGRGARAGLVLAAREPEIAHPLSDDVASVRRALLAAEPTDEEGDLPAALRLAASMASRAGAAEIVAASDDPDAKSSGAATILPVGGPAENAGIVAFEHRRFETRGEAFVAVRNFGAKPRTLRLEISLDDALLDSRTLTLPPGERKGILVETPPSAAGVLHARIDGKDALAGDDSATLLLREDSALRVLLVSPGNLFLETAWSLEPHVVVDEVAPEKFSPERAAGYDLVAFHGWAPASLPPGRYLFFDAGAPSLGMALGPKPSTSAASALEVTWQDDAHPLLRYCDLRGVRLAAARELTLEPFARRLAASGGRPLLAAVERQGTRAIVSAIELSGSDWPLKVSFPVFISNATVWLAKPRGNPWSGSLRPGDPVPLEAGEFKAGESVMVTGPGGIKSRLTAPAVFRGARRAGVYTARSASAERRFAVSLLSEKESRLAYPVGAASRPAISRRAEGWLTLSGRLEPWRLLAAACLLLLGLEWLAYLRWRTA